MTINFQEDHTATQLNNPRSSIINQKNATRRERLKMLFTNIGFIFKSMISFFPHNSPITGVTIFH